MLQIYGHPYAVGGKAAKVRGDVLVGGLGGQLHTPARIVSKDFGRVRHGATL
jgi:hypothetical protein